MKTLEQIKEEVYSEIGYKHCEITDEEIDEIAKRYADECAREALRLASENARVMTKNIDTENELEVLSWTDSRNVKFSVSKQSILSENNLPKHR